MRVLFPQPLGPAINIKFPAGKLNEISSMAWGDASVTSAGVPVFLFGRGSSSRER